jgi:TRAP-type mannitol/chloroaromatic compound transport system permease small subunit
MAIVMAATVIERYLFQVNFTWQQELTRYFHAILFLGAAGYTLLQDEHVRVDVFYQRAKRKTRAWINLLGTIFFLFPVCIAIIWFSNDFIVTSWLLLESSPEYQGLPGMFILKSFIWIFCGLLILQGISTICRSWLTIIGSRVTLEPLDESQRLL